MAAKLGLLGFVLFFVVFFSKPQGQYKSLALGDQVPDFTLRNDDGTPVSLKDFRGKIVVLNFWASWCAPCVDEIPSLKSLADRYRDKDVVVIAVSRDADPEAYKEFIAKYQVNFLTLRNPSNSVGEMYGTFQIPETYIISREGKLLNKIIGEANWTSADMISFFDRITSS